MQAPETTKKLYNSCTQAKAKKLPCGHASGRGGPRTVPAVSWVFLCRAQEGSEGLPMSLEVSCSQGEGEAVRA